MSSRFSVHPVRERFTAAFILCLPLLAGCGSNKMEAHPVDPGLARSTLDAVLKSWQEGATPESWQQKSPAVVVQDMDWKTGRKLKSFEVIEPTESVDANLHCQVKLTLEDAEKGEVEQTVKYVVGTSPVLTVFRAVEM
jgi:hypothetical protein